MSFSPEENINNAVEFDVHKNMLLYATMMTSTTTNTMMVTVMMISFPGVAANHSKNRTTERNENTMLSMIIFLR